MTKVTDNSCYKKKYGIKFFICLFKGDTVLASKKFSLVVDGKAVCDTTSFFSALSLLFSSYYIFNTEYPREAAATLEFIQR